MRMVVQTTMETIVTQLTQVFFNWGEKVRRLECECPH
jgi:hypothetical protein